MAVQRIDWLVNVVDKGSSKLLTQDRKIRSSVSQTERAQRKLAQAATSSSTAQTRGSQRTATALRGEGRAATSTAADVRRLNAAQAQALSAGGRLAGNARRNAAAYRAQASGVRELTRAQRAQAGAQRAASGAASGIGAGRAGISRVAAPIAGGAVVAGAVRTFAGFEQQMDRVEAVSGATERQMGRLNTQAKRLGAETAFSAKEAAGGMFELSTAGFRANEVMRAIPGTLDLASASGTDLAFAAEVQAAALRGFALEARDAGRVADALTATVNSSAVEMADLGEALKYIAPVARASGQSMESMLAAVGLMGNVGIKGSQAGTTLRTALVRLTDPTTKAQGALEKLGISAEDLQGPNGLIPLPEILAKIADGAQGLDKGARNQALARIFGREALSGMVTLVETGPRAIRKNIDALLDAEGQAKKTAGIMRGNVAGGWDEFTGSLETAAIVLTERFGPALRDGLRDAAGGVNDLARGGTEFLAGLTGDDTGERTVTRGPRGRVESVDVKEITELQSAGLKVRDVLESIGTTARDIGEDLLAALEPAEPFIRGGLLPMLEGVGTAIVGGWKAAEPVVHALAVVLGEVGEFGEDHPALFRAIGVALAIGVVHSKAFGASTGLLATSLKLVAAPLRLATSLVGGLGKRLLQSRAVDSFTGKVVGGIRGLGGRLKRPLATVLSSIALRFGRTGPVAASRLAEGVAGNFGPEMRSRRGQITTPMTGVARNAGRSAGAAAATSTATGLADGMGGALTARRGRFRTIFTTFFRGIGLAAGVAFATALALEINKAADNLFGTSQGTENRDAGSLSGEGGGFGIPGNNLIEDAWNSIWPGRRGGRVPRFARGGRVPILAAGGELLVDGGRASMVPGAPDRDGTLLMARPGAAVLTGDGQARMAAGASLAEAIATQAPHFRAGGIVPGQYLSTSYGPPWNAMNGTGVTATGVNLKRGPRAYGIAVDPGMIRLGRRPYVWPNPFGYTGRFSAFDTGGAIDGRRLDFYDWRGRGRQMAWGRRNVTVSAQRIRRRGDGNTYTEGGPASAPSVRILGPSRQRQGLITDALAQGMQAGAEGLTRGAIRREGNPILQAIREQMGAAGPTGGSLSQRFRPSRRGGDAGRLRSVAANTRVPYVWGGGHGAFSRRPSGLDCSGYTSHVLHYGGANPGLAAPVTTSGMARYGRSGRGQRVTIHTRTSAPAHTMLTIDGRGYSSGSRATGRLSGRNQVSGAYLRTLPIKRHPVGLRSGGIVPSFRNGGTVPGRALTRGVSSAMQFDPGSLVALDEAIGQAAGNRIMALRQQLLRRVRSGGPDRVVKRLQSLLALIDFEIGRRIGTAQARVERRTDEITRGADRQGRHFRIRGVNPESELGLAEEAFRVSTVDLPRAAANVSDIQGALKRARRAGNRGATRELETQLADAQDALQEVFAGQVERHRAIIMARAQERVDTSQFGLDRLQNDLAGREIGRRRIADTPGGMRARAADINSLLIPTLRNQVGALQGQAQAALATGDTAGFRSAFLAAQQAANELAQAQADAADLIRDAALRQAQDTVDAGAHRTTLANAGLQRLELEQRLGGTFEQGGQQRADFITNSVVPALEAELAAIRAQEAELRKQGGTPADIRAAIEAAAAKENEILQAQLDAQETIAANTEPRRFGGSLGFSFGGDTITDALVVTGNGT